MRSKNTSETYSLSLFSRRGLAANVTFISSTNEYIIVENSIEVTMKKMFQLWSTFKGQALLSSVVGINVCWPCEKAQNT